MPLRLVLVFGLRGAGAALLSLLLLIWLPGTVPAPAPRSPIEETLETQVDLRLPREFPSFKVMNVRQTGMKEIEVWNADHHRFENFSAGNWEKWATAYWYETRLDNMTCPEHPRGIAAACDWAFMIPCLFGDPNKPPKTVFVNTYMLPHFVESPLRLMPNKNWSFVLVSGGSDMTLPMLAKDARFRSLRGFGGPSGGPHFEAIVNSPQIIHWFTENRDLDHPKVSTLPTGLASPNPDDRSDFPPQHEILPIKSRAIGVLSSDRVRTRTGQWTDRANVETWCRNVTWCSQPQQGVNSAEGVSHAEFLRHLADVPFVACVHGGGLDPSPKAWEAMLLGTIPIVERTTVSDAYYHFPVAFIDSWQEFFFNPDTEALLKRWVDQLAPYYEADSELRKQVEDRLLIPYWTEQFHHRIRKHEQPTQDKKNKPHHEHDHSKHATDSESADGDVSEVTANVTANTIKAGRALRGALAQGLLTGLEHLPDLHNSLVADIRRRAHTKIDVDVAAAAPREFLLRKRG